MDATVSNKSTEGRWLMYCGKCGTQVADGAKFCPSCGQPINAPQAPQAVPTSGTVGVPTPQAAAIPGSDGHFTAAQTSVVKKSRVPWAVLGGCIALAIAIIIIFIVPNCGAGGNSPEAVVQTYIGSSFKNIDINKFFSVVPSEYIEYSADMRNESVEKFKTDTEESLKRSRDYVNKTLEDVGLSLDNAMDIKIVGTEEVTGSEFDALKAEWNNNITGFGNKFEAETKVGLRCTLTDEARKKIEEANKSVSSISMPSLEVTCVKIGGRWYVLNTTGD